MDGGSVHALKAHVINVFYAYRDNAVVGLQKAVRSPVELVYVSERLANSGVIGCRHFLSLSRFASRARATGVLCHGSRERRKCIPELRLLIDERYRGLSAQRIRYVVSSPFGDYTATELRPGHYHVATLVDVELGAWYDAEVLREIDAAAVPVSIDTTRQTIPKLRVP